MHDIDRSLFIVTLSLLLFGILVFASASVGLITREGARFATIVTKQLAVGGVGALVAFLVVSRINYRLWRRFALIIFILSVITTVLVFVPGVGIMSGGARRWISLFGISIQPAEFLKLGVILLGAALFSHAKDRIKTFREGTLPVVILSGISALLLLLQPNTGLLIVILLSLFGMFFIAGGKSSHLGVIILIALLGFGALIFTRPYVQDRIMTFISPGAANPLDEGYQTRQSLIAIGSGELFGRGFGKSIHKYNLLPEPIGDSIYAVLGEEFGFIGGAFIIVLFLLFALFGLRIAGRAPDVFGRLLASGIVILIVSQSFLNIGAMIQIFPLSGVPILFISQGGTALFFALLEVGILLNISRYKHT